MPTPPPPSPTDQLKQWFQNYLPALQTASEDASPATSSNLSIFANSTITDVLTDDDQKGTFLAELSGKTPYTFNNAQLPQSSTFENLLENVSTSPLILLFATFLQSCVGDPYKSMTSMDELSPSLLKNVFPGLTKDSGWTAFQAGLTSSVPTSCYSAAQQKAATTLLNTAGSTVGQLLQLLIKLG